MKQAIAIDNSRFPDRVNCRVPRGLNAALQLVAERQNTSPAELTRQALLRMLETKGIRLRRGEIKLEAAE